jgi:hypothetical protein
MPGQTVPLRPTLEHVVAGQNPRFSGFQIFRRAKVKFREHTPSHIRADPRDFHFASNTSVWAGDGSGPVRVRVNFGWTNSFSTLQFYNEVAQIGSHLGIIEGFMFRDRLGRRLDRENTKTKPLRIFDLQGQLTPVRLSVNQWVPGSSPGRGAKYPKPQQV